MNGEELREYCLAKAGVTEEFPFDDTTLVFKVMGKIFLLLRLDAVPLQCNLKCSPLRALQLREEFPQVLPGYHMNKKHWNTVVIDDLLPTRDLQQWIDDSYHLVVQGLNRSMRAALAVEEREVQDLR
ncbi:MAG TPA: MmcQ/YjbR family DNA-binding protein [bacterium]|jgi:predicted DNA-binding protein (MmcQ/YjbR family)|nr:MmcQ/YjbR family DNA-binding protein [bacterium]HNT66405.1 MmcQ/YjbR family DNA-binding protein [bacterium]HOX87633.1 MmcQ/YjbR family DNA-binding protein [bacterium]HPG47311.1 MmcQ/YjbR family DNA-binding protein [bacterium]HPM99595.1 MmcQ/YjbR family DNA-binding protein [bacterium]